ncbi:MAG: type III secretion system inner rod subunit SctI [Acetobacteraceae bacterium]
MEIGSVAGQAIQQALNQTGTASPAARPGTEASPDAVAALENALNSQGNAPHPGPTPGDPLADSSADARVQAVHETQAGSGPSLADRILNGLGRLSDDSKAAIDQVQASVGPQGEISPGDLLKAQYSLMQVSIQQDVTSKVVGKATQTMDTLLKNQ